MSVLLNDTGGVIRWTQARLYTRLAGGATVAIDPTLPLMVRLPGYSQAVMVDPTSLPSEVTDGGTVYTLTLDQLPPPKAVVTIMNMVTYRIGVSVDGGPVFVSGDAALDVVSPGVDSMMRFHYPGDGTSDEFEVPTGDQAKIMIAVPQNRNSPLAGTVLLPGATISEVVYAYSTDCANRLTQRRVTTTGDAYVFIIDAEAPSLGFSQDRPPAYWSWSGPALPDFPAQEPLVPLRVRIAREEAGPTPPPPAPEANRSTLFWFIISGIGLLLLIGAVALAYMLATRSSEPDTLPPAPEFPETVIL